LVATEEFRALAQQLAEFYGCPDLPMVVLPHPFNSLRHDEVIKLANQFKRPLLSKVAVEAPSA
jgi:hypothetical protein